MKPTPVPPVPEVGGWCLRSPLGQGGVSQVWSAEGPGGQIAAVKLLLDPEAGAHTVRRFLREGAFLSSTHSESLPRCMDYGDDPVPYVVLEAFEGQTLEDAIVQRGHLPISEVLHIAEELLAVISHLHRNGIIHRDIKPGNLFLTRSGHLKLLDLGLARDESGVGTPTLGDVLGTWAYMAPEQLVGAEVDHRCDLFAVGVTLYEALTGRLPVSVRTPVAQLEALRDGHRVPVVARVPDTPPRLAQTIERLMAWDPEGRPQTASMARAVILGEAAGLDRRRPELIGRGAALGAVEAALDARMPVVLLGGVGSGIHRMRAWAIDRASAQGFDVISVRGGGQGAGIGMLDTLAFQLGRFLGETPRTLSETAAGLSALAGEGPVLLVVEQVDRAPAGALLDLAHVVGAVDSVAMVLTAERDRPRLPGHRVELRPLSVLETERLAAALLGSAGCPAGLGPDLHRVSSGLPGLITVAVRELVDRGALWAEGIDEAGRPRWLLDRQTAVAPAVGLARLFGRTIARLPTPARRVLEVLAVAGQATQIEVLLEVAGAARGQAIPPAVDAGLVVLEAHPEGERLALGQPGIGPLLLRHLSRARTVQVHARLAEALSHSADAVWLEPRIRWHRAHGADGPESADELLALGEDLRQRGQLGAAVDVLQAAIDARPPSELASRVMLAKGKALAAMSRWREAAEVLRRSRERAVASGAYEIDADAGVWLAEVQAARGDSGEATATVQAVLNQLQSVATPAVHVQALTTAAELHRRAANAQGAHRLLERARTVADHADDPSLALVVDGALANLYVEGGRVAEGCEMLARLADHLRFTGRTHLLVPVLYRSAVAWRRSGRIDRAIDALDEAADVCRYAQRPHDRALERVGRASVLLAVGELEGAEATLREARVESDSDAPSALRLAYRDVQLSLRLTRDDMAAALAVAQVAEAEAVRAGHAADAAFFLGMVGVLTANGDAIDEALGLLSSAGDRRLAARLLLTGAVLGRDGEVFSAAEQEARASGDRFLMLDVLHGGGSSANREEAHMLCLQLLPHIPGPLVPPFRARPAVRWAAPVGSRGPGGGDRLEPPGVRAQRSVASTPPTQ